MYVVFFYTKDHTTIALTVRPCLPGYVLTESPTQAGVYTCVCMGTLDNSLAVLDCDDENETILLSVSTA